jgi:hypothetical protein
LGLTFSTETSPVILNFPPSTGHFAFGVNSISTNSSPTAGLNSVSVGLFSSFSAASLVWKTSVDFSALVLIFATPAFSLLISHSANFSTSHFS